jgi:hypothetical protein
MFGARKGVTLTVVTWFIAHLEHNLGIPPVKTTYSAVFNHKEDQVLRRKQTGKPFVTLCDLIYSMGEADN